MEHIRIPHKCRNFFPKFVTLVSLKVPSGIIQQKRKRVTMGLILFCIPHVTMNKKNNAYY